MEPDITTFAKTLYRASPAERVSLIRAGVPASRLPELVAAMHVSRECLLRILNLPGAATRQKARPGAMLSTEQSELVIGLMQLIGQVAFMVDDTGDSTNFDAARWVGEWLERPVPALGGAKPSDYMDTTTGQRLVSNLLVQSQLGVFA
ncbi:antitoxin Xre/MbcA/ParS toxin-binding domain-containing protein [Zoogloea sp. LCSB751]|uniref:antitoxin Xre/MbcA/ParS toxin-binding domain-containing protein n=1 Tax=Zoogloea sp. LCSB751 TaxID=1965277 RepID=UPI0013748304|nr:antitoxin Xre/MbcA/ParS toxin-binding domain-containing protein [Zoogloea sp. LCSB751]